MRLANRRPNTAVVFMDQSSGEVLLRVAAAGDGSPLLGFHLYDMSGVLVAESDGLRSFPTGGLTVRCGVGETLLETPTCMGGIIQYRLYNRDGVLLTCSDGMRTQVFRLLRMESEIPRAQPYRKEVRP